MESEIPPWRAPRRTFAFTEISSTGRSFHFMGANAISQGNLHNWEVASRSLPHSSHLGKKMLSYSWGHFDLLISGSWILNYDP